MTEYSKRSDKRLRNMHKRVQAHLEHRRGPEENRRLKARRRERDAAKARDGKRRQDWMDDDGELTQFEKIRSGGGAAPTGRGRPGGEGTPGGRSRPGEGPGVDARDAPGGDASPPPPLSPGEHAGRVVSVARGRVQVTGPDGPRDAVLCADLAASQQTGVAVGDRVVWSDGEGGARVLAVLPRRTRLSRPDPGNRHRERVIAANVDVAVLVLACRRPAFKPGLIDRFLVALHGGGVTPVVVVNKADLLGAGDERAEVLAALAPFEELGVTALLVSAESGAGMAALASRLAGRTSVFVGHSGVGKSSLLNALHPSGARPVGGGRAGDGKGRHTTTWSSLTELPDGSVVIDTPGVRAFGLWPMDQATLLGAFPELAQHGARCRFRDCSHLVEPGCAVQAAVASGDIPARRLAAYARILASLSEG